MKCLSSRQDKPGKANPKPSIHSIKKPNSFAENNKRDVIIVMARSEEPFLHPKTLPQPTM